MLYTMYKTECFSHNSGCAMRFVKHLEVTGLQCYSKNFGSNYAKNVVTKAEEYKVCAKLKI